jgi:hypothetical protein
MKNMRTINLILRIISALFLLGSIIMIAFILFGAEGEKTSLLIQGVILFLCSAGLSTIMVISLCFHESWIKEIFGFKCYISKHFCKCAQ